MKTTVSCAATAANWVDSSRGDVEDDEAEKMVRFDLLGEAPIGGDSAADAARSRPRSCRARGAREGAGERGGKGEGERAGPGGAFLSSSWGVGGPAVARGGGGGGAARRHGDSAAVATVSTTNFQKTPYHLFFHLNLVLFFSVSNFPYLVGALRKIQNL